MPISAPFSARFTVLLAGEQPLRPALMQQPLNLVHLLLILIVLAATIVALRRPRYVRAGTAVILLAFAGVSLAQSHLDADFAAQFGTADQIIAATTDYGINLIDLKSPARVVTTNAPTAPDDPLAAGLWSEAMQREGLTWFITWFPPASTENWQERDLWQRASFVRETGFRGDRALLFHLAPPVEAAQSGGWHFGPLDLAAYGLRRDTEGLSLTLAWRADTTPDQDYTWFVHLLDSQGQIVQQQDRAAQGGYAPTSSWQPGVQVMDYLYFPASDAASGWTLRIGVVNPAGDLLPVRSPSGEPLPDPYILLPLD